MFALPTRRPLRATLLLSLPLLVACATPGLAQEPPATLKTLAVRWTDPALGTTLESTRFARSFARFGARLGWQLRPEAWRADAPATEAELVLTTVPIAPELTPWLRGLPVDLAGRVPMFAGERYPGESIAVALRLPGSTRWLIAGRNADAVAALATDCVRRAVGARFWGRDEGEVDFVVQESWWVQRTGRWAPVEGAWKVDPVGARDDFAARERWFRGLVPVGGPHVRLLVPAPRAQEPGLRALAAELDSAVVAFARRVPFDPAGLIERPLTVALETDFVDQVQHTGAIGYAVPGGAADLHVVLGPRDTWALRVALAGRVLARAGLEDPRRPWLTDGAALWLAGEWYGRPYAEWLPLLAAAEVMPTAAELLGAERPSDSSDPLWVPVAAALLEKVPGVTVGEKLSLPLGSFGVEAVLRRLGRERDSGRSPSRRPLPGRFLAGISFAHDNSLTGGYHAPAIRDQLGRLRRIGATAVSLMPFAYQRSPDSPELGFENRSPTSENDAGMVHAARLAQAEGYTVLWKPHLWISSDSWPGAVEMNSAEDWATWWRRYRRYVLHQAFLAEYAGAEAFSVGVELDKTHRFDGEWRRLITDTRRFFHGPVTYAANWGKGAETVTFWDALDVVGVDTYYPLVEPVNGQTTAASDAELARGAALVADRLAAFARKAGKPVWLTEVGFPARRHAWSDPHREGGDLSLEDQERAYQALFAALSDRPWLGGVFVWKAFSGASSRRDRGGRSDFQFLDRPAEQVVKEFFQRYEPIAAGGR